MVQGGPSKGHRLWNQLQDELLQLLEDEDRGLLLQKQEAQ